jgi:hypothetical protein
VLVQGLLVAVLVGLRFGCSFLVCAVYAAAGSLSLGGGVIMGAPLRILPTRSLSCKLPFVFFPLWSGLLGLSCSNPML